MFLCLRTFYLRKKRRGLFFVIVTTQRIQERGSPYLDATRCPAGTNETDLVISNAGIGVSNSHFPVERVSDLYEPFEYVIAKSHFIPVAIPHPGDVFVVDTKAGAVFEEHVPRRKNFTVVFEEINISDIGV